MGRGVPSLLKIMRYLIAEKTDEKTCKPIKGMRFKTFDAACKLAARLSSIHTGTTYIVIDTQTNNQFNITELL